MTFIVTMTDHTDLLNLQLQLQQNRTPYALATVVEIVGSSSAKPAAKALFAADGKLLAGWIGGGCAQSMIAETTLDCLASGEPKVVDVDLTDEIFGAGMPCGGHMRVYVEAVLPKPQLWLMGHGRIVESLCEFAAVLNFDVIVDDPQARPERFPKAVRIIADDPRYQLLRPEPGDFVLIATHHKGDYASLSQALNSAAVYIGLVSSRKRARLIAHRLAQAGIGREQIAKIRAPAGLDLGAKHPEEIALSIASEMLMLKRGGHGQPLSDCACAGADFTD
ncbi:MULTISPECIES: XdhC family protein [Methylomonas]|uniref:XdhC family protein n=1 Tax=Methylomonas TaxID=416 RepID=UPI001E3138D8|nr:XdhC family protein [Methylomonas rhizoryzae]